MSHSPTSPASEPLLLKAAEAAERMRISLRTFSRLHQRREVPYLKLGGQVRFPADALDAWLRAQLATIWRQQENSKKIILSVDFLS